MARVIIVILNSERQRRQMSKSGVRRVVVDGDFIRESEIFHRRWTVRRESPLLAFEDYSYSKVLPQEPYLLSGWIISFTAFNSLVWVRWRCCYWIILPLPCAMTPRVSIYARKETTTFPFWHVQRSRNERRHYSATCVVYLVKRCFSCFRTVSLVEKKVFYFEEKHQAHRVIQKTERSDDSIWTKSDNYCLELKMGFILFCVSGYS